MITRDSAVMPKDARLPGNGRGAPGRTTRLTAQAMRETSGIAATEASSATKKTIITSLKRQGKRFVQCLVLSKIDISVIQ